MKANVPGFVWTAGLTALTTFLVMLQTGISTDVTDYWGPMVVAAIGAILKAIETMSAPEQVDGTRSIEAPRSKVSRFLLGG